MPEEIEHDPVNPGAEAEPAEGKTNQPDVSQDTVAEGDTDQSSVETDEEQVATLTQTPNEELAVDPDIEQPSQVPTDIVESDPGAEDEE